MAKLPVFKRIQREDFPDAPNWIDKVIYPINKFFESTYNALNKQLAFEENVTAEIRSFEFTTLAGYDGTAANFDPLTFQRNLRSAPEGLLLLQISKFGLATYSPIEGDVYVDWIHEEGIVTIGLVRGLAVSTKYNLRVMII